MKEVIFEIRLDKNAPAHCVDCHVDMTPAKIELIRKDVTIKDIDAFVCSKCGKEMIDVETASRIEREFGSIKK